MGQALGKLDPSATNDMLGGQAVATGTPGAKTVADPNQGLTQGQMFARKALSNSLSGLGQGLQQQGNAQSQGFQPPINTPQAPMVDPRYFGVQGPKNPFYGG